MRRISQIVIIVSTIVLIAYDIVAAVKGGTGGTISAVFWTWSKSYPAVPFAAGFLMGHLFWQAPEVK